LKTVKIEAPEGRKSWPLGEYSFEIDDALRGIEREMISRRANAVGFRAGRLHDEGGSWGAYYEDKVIAETLAEQYAACRKCVKKIFRDGQELTADKREELLDALDIMERDAVSNEVAGANALGLGNVSGSPSS